MTAKDFAAEEGAREYWLIHEASRRAGRFQEVALSHLDRPCPASMERALRDLKEALDRLDLGAVASDALPEARAA